MNGDKPEFKDELSENTQIKLKYSDAEILGVFNHYSNVKIKEIVHKFCDINFRKQMKEQGELYINQLTQLDASGRLIKELCGIDLLQDLTELDISNNDIDNLHDLESLSHLQLLNIENNPVKKDEVDNLENQLKIEIEKPLFVGDLEYEDTLFAAAMVPFWNQQVESITVLSLSNRGLTGVSELAHYSRLITLNLGNNSLFEQDCLDFLYALKSLTDLDLSYNKIDHESDAIANISSLTSLEDLNLNSNKIADISFVTSLRNLTSLYLYDNSIADTAALSDSAKLQILWLNHNSISNINGLANLKALTLLRLDYNQISDLSPLYSLSELKDLWLSGNTDLSFQDINLLQEALPNCIIRF
ncbi:MAG: leucine-rich repeat domain-containing protein [Spirochaetales bacterium]|nr:leucine-rich repeat domain-containing protein [Spirochaetales bacterium]